MMENSNLKTVLGEIEALRIKRQREFADQPHPCLKRFTQQELNDEACPTYKNLLVGRSRRVPNRQTIFDIAEYLECTTDERNDLLVAAGYLPTPTEWEGSAMELALDAAQRTMKSIPFPAMIITHSLDIKGYNEPFRRLFDIPLDHHYDDNMMNSVDFHFSYELPIRSRSTFNKAACDQWKAHAIAGIQSFKRNHVLSRYDAWYQKVIDKAEQYNVYEPYWNDHHRDGKGSMDRTQTILARVESSGELVPVGYKQISVSPTSHVYPQIVVFLPVDPAARKVFADLGCPSECVFA
ncbi:hypothetical protein [Paenibacillus sp. XY044]|uniref:MmyB family transcriptional regulator n=1 Tax=Paenibacillus sp. XY044 TaxID=2026089 RepID=UPI000B99C735|nr:hypothetical protein [Paenibacillus sp. XY044]OZB94278.1 hypothetical protein CJP46_18915 [Paenibacillus sp. XY044]